MDQKTVTFNDLSRTKTLSQLNQNFHFDKQLNPIYLKLQAK